MYAAIRLREFNLEQSGALKQCAGAFSPLVEDTGPGLVVADIHGLGKLIGDAHQIGDAIFRKAEDLGLTVNVALAVNVDAAVLAATGFEGLTVIGFVSQAKVLGPLPISTLDMPDHMIEVLENWGIRTFAQFAALPERGIAERLGTAGLLAQKRARGLFSRPLVPILDPATFEQSMELEHPLELLEPLAFLLSRFLNELCERLNTNGFASNEAEVALLLEDKTVFVRSVQLPTPTTDAAVLWKLLQYDLEAHPPHAPIIKVSLRLVPVPPAVLQHGLFLPQAPEPQKLELILARISAIVGEGNAGTPELLNTHRPGAYRMARFGAGAEQASVGEATEPHLAIRLFRPALPASVLLSEGRPLRVTAKGVGGAVVAWAGPWRTSGDWWTSDPWCRDEWDVALQDGALYRIYYEPGQQGGRWFVDGNYD